MSTGLLCDLNCMDSGARGIPLYLRPAERELSAEESPDRPIPNLSEGAAIYLAELGSTEAELFHHCLAVTHSLSYRWENTDALRLDWPRIPLPSSLATLTASATLGREVGALLNTEKTLAGVTAGEVRRELHIVAVPSRRGGGPLDPGKGDLRVVAGWGYRQNGAVMAGQGSARERAYTEEEQATVRAGAEALGIAPEEAFARLGESVFDVDLNGVAYWACVPSRVWGYTMGGYQVIKKWLSYREEGVLGRQIGLGEVREARDVARRIAALLLLEPRLDGNYDAAKASYFRWEGEG